MSTCLVFWVVFVCVCCCVYSCELNGVHSRWTGVWKYACVFWVVFLCVCMSVLSCLTFCVFCAVSELNGVPSRGCGVYVKTKVRM